MSLKNLIDTVLNLWVFAFIGILVWLYFKTEKKGNEDQRQESDRKS
jgi:hypothetical protein